jgi:hypothetical protein
MCDSICLFLGHRREMEQSGPGPVNCGRRRRDARHPRTRGTAAAMEASSKVCVVIDGTGGLFASV